MIPLGPDMVLCNVAYVDEAASGTLRVSDRSVCDPPPPTYIKLCAYKWAPFSGRPCIHAVLQHARIVLPLTKALFLTEAACHNLNISIVGHRLPVSSAWASRVMMCINIWAFTKMTNCGRGTNRVTPSHSLFMPYETRNVNVSTVRHGLPVSNGLVSKITARLHDGGC